MRLQGRALSIGYRDRLVGQGLDVALDEGEVLALLGPNGGSKPNKVLSNVVLPPPFGPSSASTSPFANWTSRPVPTTRS